MMSSRKHALSVLASGAVDGSIPAICFLVESPLVRSELDAIKISLKSNLSTHSFSDLSQVLKAAAQITPDEFQVGLAADVLTYMLEKTAEVSSRDALRVVGVCGKLGVFDSELFHSFEQRVRIETSTDLSAAVKAMNKLNVCFFEAAILDFAADYPLSLRFWFPVCQFFLRSTSAPNQLRVQQLFLAAVHLEVELLRANEDLLKQRSHLSADDGVRIISILAKLHRMGCTEIGMQARTDLVFILTKIVAYELRNLELPALLKLFFSLAQIEVFDDFFVRRRLVPAVAHTFKNIPERKSRDLVLVLTMLAQLPFTNSMVEELSQTVITEFKSVKTTDKYYDTGSSIISKLVAPPY